MYQQFYGLTSKPFHIIPDLAFLFMSTSHKVALDCMEFGLMNNAGMILITGDIGIGKTTMVRRLLQELQKEYRPACVYNTNLDPEQFLILVMQEFGIEPDTVNKSRNIHAIQKFFQSMRKASQRPLLIVDDAQNLSAQVLEEVRWLSGLQDENGMLLQIILVGQPELKARLAHPAMASLSQRIGVSYDLTPFSREETEDYIEHRLSKAGRSTPLFTQAAIDKIYKVTSGVPRTINLLCDHALVYGFADSLQQIDVPVIEQVEKEIGGYGVGFGTQRPAVPVEPDSPVAPNGQDENGDCLREELLHLRKDMAELMPRLKKLEARSDSFERALSFHAGELQKILRDQLREERQRNERLTVEVARLKAQATQVAQVAKAPAATSAPIVLAQKKGRE